MIQILITFFVSSLFTEVNFAHSNESLQAIARDILILQASKSKFDDATSKRMRTLGFTSGELACYRLGMLPSFAWKAWALAQEAPEEIENE